MVETLQRQVAELERQNADLRAEIERLQRSVSELLETKWGRGRSFGLGLRRLFGEIIAPWHEERARGLRGVRQRDAHSRPAG